MIRMLYCPSSLLFYYLSQCQDCFPPSYLSSETKLIVSQKHFIVPSVFPNIILVNILQALHIYSVFDSACRLVNLTFFCMGIMMQFVKSSGNSPVLQVYVFVLQSSILILSPDFLNYTAGVSLITHVFDLQHCFLLFSFHD